MRDCFVIFQPVARGSALLPAVDLAPLYESSVRDSGQALGDIEARSSGCETALRRGNMLIVTTKQKVMSISSNWYKKYRKIHKMDYKLSVNVIKK